MYAIVTAESELATEGKKIYQRSGVWVWRAKLTEAEGRTIFVGGLPYEADNVDVKRYFGWYGNCAVDIKWPRGFGFVHYADTAAAAACLRDKGTHFICGSEVDVKPYERRLTTGADEWRTPRKNFARKSEPHTL